MVRLVCWATAALAASAIVGFASDARALACSDTHFVPFDTEFTDCAGNVNFLDSGTVFPFVEHEDEFQPPHQGASLFSDLHIVFLDAVVTSIVDGSFANIEVDPFVLWNIEGDFDDDISFIAPDLEAAILPGDLYDWFVAFEADLSGLTGLNIHVEYTMDLPEPGVALPLLSVLLALSCIHRRHARDG
ncbi:MAG: hypothetical protein HKP30_12710 [Myxococcales bacterium]|nr:hypothetical protein [Myxococcales bacterium]